MRADHEVGRSRLVIGIQSPARRALAATRQQTARTEAASKIVARLRSQIDELTEAAMGEIFAGIPGYETTVDPAFVRDVREHVHEHYEAVFDGLEADRTVTPEDLVFVRKHASQRIGLVSVADFIGAFQIGPRVMMDAA